MKLMIHGPATITHTNLKDEHIVEGDFTYEEVSEDKFVDVKYLYMHGLSAHPYTYRDYTETGLQVGDVVNVPVGSYGKYKNAIVVRTSITADFDGEIKSILEEDKMYSVRELHEAYE